MVQDVAMAELTEWISPHEVALISLEDKRWLEGAFHRFRGYPNLEQIWTLMAERIGAYYSHPVWLVNGLLIEQHNLSRENGAGIRAWHRPRHARRGPPSDRSSARVSPPFGGRNLMFPRSLMIRAKRTLVRLRQGLFRHDK
jgi:hypothetical protein